jgi:hypothetical protein
MIFSFINKNLKEKRSKSREKKMGNIPPMGGGGGSHEHQREEDKEHEKEKKREESNILFLFHNLFISFSFFRAKTGGAA